VTSPQKNSFVEMFDLLMTASVDRSNVETHCAFCRKFFDGSTSTPRWDCFQCWDTSIINIGEDDDCILFLVCDDCREMGCEIQNRFIHNLLIKFPNESTLFKADGYHGANY